MGFRNLSIDFIKVIAMFAVIGLHTFDANMEWHFANVLYESCVIAIPLFFMSSGYLLIPKANINVRYVFKKVFGIIRFLFIISFLYWFVSSIYSFLYIRDLYELIVGMMIQKGPLFHCWYLITMIILYIILPFLNWMFLNKLNYLLYSVFILVFFDNALFIVNLICDKPIEMNVIQPLRLWNWLLYFLVGGFVSVYKDRIKYFCKKPFLLMVIMLLFLNILCQELLRPYMNSPFCEYFYCSIFVELLSLCIFSYVLFLKIKKTRLLVMLSNLFLPVYIFHPFFLVISSRICFHFFSNEFALLARFFVVSITTISFSYLFMKIPYMSKVFRI